MIGQKTIDMHFNLITIFPELVENFVSHGIISKAVEEQVDIIGLSGLITPSLDEMCHVAAEMERRGIQHRFKTSRYTPNSLGMIDEKIKRVKTYIRQRLTEAGEDAESWTQYFGPAVAAQN